ncbi:MAG: hypothetical protein HYU76_09035 [Betaproteobacteria bacterium]|nr:hypothetical protein [Betaproteobacteria bacterium]
MRELHAGVVGVLRQPEVRQRLDIEAFDVVGNTPEEFAKYLKAEYVKWAKVVKETGARVD